MFREAIQKLVLEGNTRANALLGIVSRCMVSSEIR